MTRIAQWLGINVGRRPTRSNRIIVTVDTDTDGLRVIHPRRRNRQPRRGRRIMTAGTTVGAIDMGRRLAAGKHTVVTTDTGTLHLPVIHLHAGQRCPNGETRVAGFADFRSRQMRRGFGRGTNTRGMTERAIIADRQFGVGKRRWQPGTNTMTEIARFGCGYMVYGFTGRQGRGQNGTEFMATVTGIRRCFVVIHGAG